MEDHAQLPDDDSELLIDQPRSRRCWEQLEPAMLYLWGRMRTQQTIWRNRWSYAKGMHTICLADVLPSRKEETWRNSLMTMMQQGSLVWEPASFHLPQATLYSQNNRLSTSQANRLRISYNQAAYIELKPHMTSWQPQTCRIGEAKKPGPSICSGGWSRVAGTLDLGHDVVVVQETFLIRDALATGHFGRQL
eukprot:6018682-Amphidinium_carterae.1